MNRERNGVENNPKRMGFTLIELLIALAIAAILIGVGATQFNPGGSATSQAAEVVAGAANRARVSPGGGSFCR